MPTGMTPNPNSDTRTPNANTSGGSPVGAKDLPGTHADDSTVKNPKTPESSGASRADRAANKAAHKAAKDEAKYDAEKGIFSR